MPFDASQPEIVSLDYDFRPYVNASGTTPEPSEDLIYEFQSAVRDNAKLLGREGEIDPKDPESFNRFMRTLSKEDRRKLNEEQFKALAKLTQGRPSLEDMLALSKKAPRHAQAYMVSIVNDVLNPKG